MKLLIVCLAAIAVVSGDVSHLFGGTNVERSYLPPAQEPSNQYIPPAGPPAPPPPPPPPQNFQPAPQPQYQPAPQPQYQPAPQPQYQPAPQPQYQPAPQPQYQPAPQQFQPEPAPAATFDDANGYDYKVPGK
ncbi:circumsporozoite protein-like [Bradysia coprophila]|nr:circumsporozoite protein-like [Bradysia coprophila]